ncbi:hypothetical protein Tco_0934194 [Tanacetum coccineum]
MDDTQTMAQIAQSTHPRDSLNSAAGGNFLDKMPRDCLRIIESKSKVRNSRNKPVVAKVSSSTSTPGISSDVAELKDMVKALLLDKKNQSPAPTPVKAVEESCVTCGGAHSYQTCPATTGNVYRDNIQEYVSQAAAANYNQGNTGYRAPISNQIRPPGFPPVQNNHNVQNQGNNQNRYNQNRGNFNQAPAYQPPVHQGQIYRPQVVQPPAYQAPAYQAPAPQIQGVSKEDFQAYVKANDAVMRNMQTQGQNMQNQLTNLTDMLSKFVTSNTASTSGTLPSNTVTNPKEDLKGITTRSGVAYKGPTIHTTSSPKVVEREPELKDMVKALLLDKKNQSPAPTPVKAVEESCVTCGGAHSYQTCPATTGNVYRDNIQEYVSQAAAANYNQGNTGYRAPISNQIRPPGFPPAQNNHNVQNQGNNQNRYNQNRGNFNQAPAYQPPVHQGQIYRPQVVQPPAYQAPAYQAPAPQIQGVSKEDFQAYVKANDAVMRNMQTQGQNMQNQLTNLTDMLSKFLTSNTASTSGTLPSNTVTNTKEDLKGITTRSGVAYQGPTVTPPNWVAAE